MTSVRSESSKWSFIFCLFTDHDRRRVFENCLCQLLKKKKIIIIKEKLTKNIGNVQEPILYHPGNVLL